MQIDLLKNIEISNGPQNFISYSKQMLSEQNGATDYLTNLQATWNPPTALAKKVTLDGSFKIFHGDTTVFKIREKTLLTKLAIFQDEIHHLPIFADRLNNQELHMTLHDLNNGEDKVKIDQLLPLSEKKVRSILRGLHDYLQDHPEDEYITMQNSSIFPCLNISLLLGLLPKTETDFKILFNCYSLFDQVTTLNYFLRPHVTLGYFLPRNVFYEERIALHKLIIKLNQERLEFKFSLKDLVYQHFFSMNDYRDIFYKTSSKTC